MSIATPTSRPNASTRRPHRALQTSVNRLRELMGRPAVLPTYSPRSRR
ncbi:hypothetical protein I551_8798 [Mycobacterium ulcerans str. Harvey]|uniref:Uncharacterized protein n=1 Tax=Mycobacterium ulcerans str. Harvey TaxID=1299332 RepID=A0ABN0RAN9_MYCUL|nr:hypothetical protein I551_8798 [Mycobacterium ulcerans str. Harvey]